MSRRSWRAFEVILAVGLLGAVAVNTVPHFGHAAAPLNEGALLRSALQTLRVAIERYYLDHGLYPGQRGDGQNPPGSEAALIAQLTKYTDVNGQASDVPGPTHCFGPYLRDGVPPCPVPPRLGQRGVHMVSGTTLPEFAEQAEQAGWTYNFETGQIAPNSDAADSAGRSYRLY